MQQASQTGGAAMKLDREQIADQIGEIVLRLSYLDRASADGPSAQMENELEFLIGCDFHYLEGLTKESQNMAYFDPDSMSATDMVAASPSIDIGFAVRKDDHLSLLRVWSVPLKELRGRTRMVSRHNARYVEAKLYGDGTWYTQGDYVSLINNKWVCSSPLEEQVRSGRSTLTKVRIDSEQTRTEINRSMSMAFSAALSHRYCWHAAMGIGDHGPRLLLATSAKGCLELFKSRDPSPGRTRRDALRHWVKNHYRDSSECSLSYVRDHLRGQTRFDWHGLNCELMVSAYDLERNEAFKVQAENWRAQRQHNRVRVRLKRRSA
jgi:hypothetical protein